MYVRGLLGPRVASLMLLNNSDRAMSWALAARVADADGRRVTTVLTQKRSHPFIRHALRLDEKAASGNHAGLSERPRVSLLLSERSPNPLKGCIVLPGNRSVRMLTNHGGEDGTASMVLPQSGRDATGNLVSRSAARSISLSHNTKANPATDHRYYHASVRRVTTGGSRT